MSKLIFVAVALLAAVATAQFIDPLLVDPLLQVGPGPIIPPPIGGGFGGPYGYRGGPYGYGPRGRLLNAELRAAETAAVLAADAAVLGGPVLRDSPIADEEAPHSPLNRPTV